MLPLLMLFLLDFVPPYNLQVYSPIQSNSISMSINHTFTAIPVRNTAYLINGATPNGDWYQAGIDYDYGAKGWTYVYEYWDNKTSFNYTMGLEQVIPIKNYSKVSISMSIKGNELVTNWHELNNSQMNITYIQSIKPSHFISKMNTSNGTIIFTGTMTEMRLPWLK